MTLDSFVARFCPDGGAFRTRTWARFVVKLSILSSPVWPLFMVIAVAIGLPVWSIGALGLLGAAQLTLPWLYRTTGSLRIVMMVFGTIAFAGVTLAAFLLGGFPFHSLMWSIAIPVTIAAQREVRGLLPMWTAIVLGQFVGWYGLASAGLSPPVTVAPTFEIWLHACSLLAWFGLMLLIARSASVVTYQFVASRDAYQRALLQGQKLNAVGKLAGSIENNFNNALMSVDYSLHLLREHVDDPEIVEELDEMTLTAARCKALSRKLERLGHGDVEKIELVEVDVAVEAIRHTLRRSIGSSTLTLHLDAATAHVLCDANQLDQVLLNLVVNARDAMPEGGEIKVSTRVVDGQVLIDVSDTGSGIAPSVMRHIFEPFFTTKDPDSGTGLGLWICRSIIEGCGGTLTPTSAVGVGTTMTIALPLGRTTDVSPSRRLRVIRPVEITHAIGASPRASWSSRLVAPFVREIGDARLRIWAGVLVLIGAATVPVWWTFAVLQLAEFGVTPNVVALAVAGALAACVPWSVKIWRSPVPGAYGLAASSFVALATIALVSGGFRTEILIWATIIPILGAQQQELRHLSTICSVAVLALILVVFGLALTGVTHLPPLSPDQFLGQQFAILTGSLLLLVVAFRAASRVGNHFAHERDDYAATLVKSQDFESAGTLASSIAHDLNNVLTTIEIGTELITSKLPPEHPAAPHLSELQWATGQIQGLTRQLTRFGRANTGTASVVPDTALATLAKMLGPIVGSHIKICMDLDSGSAPIKISSNELDQLVVNLALNARDAMPDGGELHIRTSSTGSAVAITVRDVGVGIPASVLPHVCEPFFTTSADHVGLGLWVCREIVQEAHGKLEVTSTPGSGTTVHIVIPHALPRTSDSMRRLRATPLQDSP